MAELNLDAGNFYADLFINVIKPKLQGYLADDVRLLFLSDPLICTIVMCDTVDILRENSGS